MKEEFETSVIIPCFNAEKYIKKCIESILKSNYRDFELLIVDDASSDNTREFLEVYKKNKKIKIILQQKNSGPVKSRNFGVKKSKGKYIIFLDSDTKVSKDSLRLMVDALKENNKIGAVQAHLINKTIDAGHFLTLFGFPYSVEKSSTIFGAKTAAMAIKKDLFQDLGGFDEDYKIYGEDTDISWRIWLSGHKIISVQGTKVYHSTKGSITSTTKFRIFYEGAKNSTSNIIKNASLKNLFIMLPLNVLAWGLLFCKLALQLRVKESLNILNGLTWNLLNMTKTLRKRKTIKRVGKKETEKIMFGNLRFTEFFTKGWRWFTNV